MSKAGARPADGRGRPAPTQPAGSPAAASRAAGSDAPASQLAGSDAPASQLAQSDAAVSRAGSDDTGGGAAGEPGRGRESVTRAGGILVSIVFAFVSALLELLLTTLRAGDFGSIWRGDAIGSGGGPLIPLSVVLAVAGNLGLAWFAVGTTGRRWALGPPWAVWTIVMLIAAGVRTHEGDYLLSGTNYVALAMILIGSLTFAIYTYRMILSRIPPAPGSTSGPRGN